MDLNLKNKVIEYYTNNNVSILKMTKVFDLSYSQINRILRNNNVYIKGGRKRKKFTEDEIADIRNKYESNKYTISQLSKEYNVDTNTLSFIIRKNEISKPNNNFVNKFINEDYFEVIDSPLKAYWIGFLFADGNVRNIQNTTYQIRFGLKKDDVETIIKFKNDLNLDAKIEYDNRGNGYCSIGFVSKKMFDDLKQYNIVPNKTYEIDSLKLEFIPDKYRVDFVRGLFDGDGCITYDEEGKDVTLHFTSYSKNITMQIQQIIDKMIKKNKSNKIFKTNAWHCAWRGKQQVLKIMDKLYYENCERYLERKRDKYLNLKNKN